MPYALNVFMLKNVFRIMAKCSEPVVTADTEPGRLHCGRDHLLESACLQPVPERG